MHDIVYVREVLLGIVIRPEILALFNITFSSEFTKEPTFFSDRNFNARGAQRP